jgi:GntR family transcriptional regulator
MPDRLTIRFDPLSGVPAVRQIADNLRVLLVERKLGAGAVLPSVRRLAMELGVHFNTVAEAYRELAAEGWLDLQHGRGAVVIARPARTAQSKNWIDEFRNRLRGLVAQVRADGASADELAAELRAMAKAVKESCD